MVSTASSCEDDEGSGDLILPFPFPDPKPWRTKPEARNKRHQFWDSHEALVWFKSRGYTLYERLNKDPDGWPGLSRSSPRVHENTGLVSSPYPFSFHDGQKLLDVDSSRDVTEFSGGIGFAQDQSGRHVAIKIVARNTEELKILDWLKGQPLEVLKENCIIPVLDILETSTHCFAVMPRWGPGPWLPGPTLVYEVVSIIKSLLKALAFLHCNGILHRDISDTNMLLNHFSSHNDCEGSLSRFILRHEKKALYAIFDFDISIMLPEGVDRSRYRLPWHMAAHWGSYFIEDVSQGELVYDPFAWDVGVMGSLICMRYQHLATRLPSLPLCSMG
ncbi:hypothetical protein BKA70DRAFT_19754 [Coprinopsis sp. MPI-PUGE-AT-0042]|nr:hypothetical protein BKA70DRAFT_19754 [Coprinopsis sp. MPI-PUGE-AT-0042]